MSNQMKKPVGVNRENFADKVKSYLRHPGSMILMLLVMYCMHYHYLHLLFVPDFLYSGKWNSVYQAVSVLVTLYIRECIRYTGADQYGRYDSAFSSDCSTIRNLFCNLPRRICRKRQ